MPRTLKGKSSELCFRKLPLASHDRGTQAWGAETRDLITLVREERLSQGVAAAKGTERLRKTQQTRSAGCGSALGINYKGVKDGTEVPGLGDYVEDSNTE